MTRILNGTLAKRCPEYFLMRLLLALSLLAVASFAQAFQPITPQQQGSPPKTSHAFISADDIEVQPELEQTTRLTTADAQHAGVKNFITRNSGDWEMRWDRRSDRPNLIQGSGVPLIPGRGNSLSLSQLGLAANETVDMAVVETRLRDFIEANSDLLKTNGLEFQLDPNSSIPYGKDNLHWFVEFAQYKNGVRVEGANLFFRIAAGNIVQFGANQVAPVTIDVQPVSTRQAAFDLALQELAFPTGTNVQEIIEPGELLLVPVTPAGQSANESYRGVAGNGYEHRLVWRFVFRVDGDRTTYQVLLDAHTNRVIDIKDLNEYVNASVNGGIYPTTNTDAEVVVPMPFAAVTNGAAKVTDALGIYDYGSGTATTALNGKYFMMKDDCGAISLSNTTNGNLALGTSGGTDCTTPGVGGAGNTHASRSGFYHLTNINRKAITFFPTNSWLQGKVTAEMNENDVCNAFWDGSKLNFFKSGSGCSNTGEIAAVFLHEWGHGMDTNSGGAASEYGSGEAVGDTFAFLETKDACIGKNFQPGVPCANCATACTGVRDLNAFSTHGARTVAKPSTVTDNNGINCDRYACPYNTPQGQAYRGPMGYEGHCESYIASSANWDLSQALVAAHGSTGWGEMDKIWYGSLTPSKSAYRVASGGTCNANASVDGCGSNNWYTVYLAADDDDGNLANGTPNACRIWDAFNAHGIACGTRPVCTADNADFTLETTSDDHATLCAGLGSPVSYSLLVGATGGFQNVVTLGASGAPAGTTVTIDPTSGSPGIFANVSIDSPQPPPGQQPPVVGDYVVTVAGTAANSPGHSVPLYLNIRTTASTTTLSSPVDGATGVPVPTTFTWQPADNAETYRLIVATDVAHQNIVLSIDLTDTTFTTTALQPGTTYYWLAYSEGSCGGGSQQFSFTTAQPYQVGGNVNGLEGDGLILSLNGAAQTLPVSASGEFAFPNALASGATYAVTVGTQPTDPTQTCTVANGSGTIGSANVTNVAVNCTTSNFAVGGTVSGLAGSGLTLSLGAQTLPISTSGAFTFPTSLASGATYAVTVGTQPSGPTQTCAVSNGSGTIGSANVTNVAVTCTTSTFTVGGSVSGLAGTGFSLSLGAQTLPVSASGSFTFPTAIASGASYAVTVGTQPSSPTQTCTVSNGSGTIGSTNVANVAVTCTTSTFMVGGSVSGLAGTGLSLSLGAQTLPVSASGSFTFPTAIASGASYAVSVGTQPSNPTQTCTVSNGSGTVGSANVTNVAVSCTTNNYTVGGTVSGLVGNSVTLTLNGGEQTQVISANGAFTFPTAVASGSTYAVSVSVQPTSPTEVCTITNGSGIVVDADASNIVVSCIDRIFADGFEG